MRRSLLRAVVLAAAVIAAAGSAVGTSASAARPTLSFRVFASTGRNMNSIVWTGTQFLYVENTANTVWAAPPAGLPIAQFATMPRLVEETRCILSPGTHGFSPGVIFCHSPDNKIYEISADGATVSVFATLSAPYPPPADGALIFDNVGKFGYRLVAATGRSGALSPSGGLLFAIDSSGNVQQVGSYPGPGGADEVAIAPAGFGSAAGDALVSADAGVGGGALEAIGANGQARTIASFPADGPNPVVPIPAAASATGTPAPGLYLSDDLTQDIYFAPASQLARFAGDVIVGTEIHAHFWIIKPHGKGFLALRVRHNLRGVRYSLEGGVFLG